MSQNSFQARFCNFENLGFVIQLGRDGTLFSRLVDQQLKRASIISCDFSPMSWFLQSVGVQLSGVYQLSGL